MIKLTITEKGGEPRSLSFDQNEVSIGRVQGNDIVLPKGNISKRHSKLTLLDGKMVVADAKSTNGTYVNGRKIGEPTPVRAGDKIFVGDFLIVIDPHTAATAEASATGSRRAPPPPPPPPPRPGSGVRPAPEFGDPGESGGAFGDMGHGAEGAGDSNMGDVGFAAGLGSGRGRPPAPPPPPPRRTIVTPALPDDSVDIGAGADDEPPAPDEVGGDMGDLGVDSEFGGMPQGRSGLARRGSQSDVDDAGRGGVAPDGGSGVFGSRPADDEDDAALAGGRPGNAQAPSSAAFGSLEALFTDPAVKSIIISAGGAMRVDRAGRIETVPAVGDGNAIAETVWQIANTAVPPPPADNPVVDVRLPDGTRLTALFPPITVGSVSAVIRKLAMPELPLADVAGGTDVEAILRAALTSRRNLLLAGDVPAVAALFATLGEAVPAERTVVSIGGPTKARAGWIELGMGPDPASLARAAVAFQAEHLLFADGGGAELAELLLAAARGQEGLIACMAARSAAEALTRLRAFTVAALGVTGFGALVTSTLDLIIVVGSGPAGSAGSGSTVRVLEIAELQLEGETAIPVVVARRPENNRQAATLEVSGVSSRLASAIAAASGTADGLPGHLIRR
ncbi:MAG: FHA domain-containing protein [Myxococcales bacterium]